MRTFLSPDVKFMIVVLINCLYHIRNSYILCFIFTNIIIYHLVVYKHDSYGNTVIYLTLRLRHPKVGLFFFHLHLFILLS